MYYFNEFTLAIMRKYRTHLEMIDSQLIGFTATASERPAPIYTNEVDADSLFFACNVNFSNANVLIRIQSISPQYQWMANQNTTPLDTPIGAIAGISSQAMPVLPLIQPFFLKKNGKLQMQFTNSAASPSAATSIITWRLLKLVDPIEGGWDYGMLAA